MAHFHGHQGDDMTVLYVMFISLLFIATRADTNLTFYQGCYNNTVPGGEAPFLLARNPPSDVRHNPVECSRECAQLGYEYVCISPKGCGCLTAAPDKIFEVDDNSCEYRCDSFADFLRCGSQYFISVYLSHAPYLAEVDVESEASVYVGQHFAIHVTAKLTSTLNTSIGIDEAADIDAGVIAVEWESRGQNYSDKTRVADGEDVARAAWVTAFEEEGNYTIDIQASNGLSIIVKQINLTVLLPVPTNLQLSVITPGENLPSCLPSKQGLIHADKAILVFKDVPVVFEASVHLGISLTFHWAFSDDIDSPIDISYGDNCYTQECRVNVQNHTFGSLGEQEVAVSVENAHARLNAKLYVIVLERAIQDVTFTLKDEEHQAITPGNPVYFLAAMVSPSRQTTTLDFHPGDGTIKQYSFKEQNRTARWDAAFADEADEDSVFHLLSSYGDGCQLTAELQCTYHKQGTFSPAVHISNGPSSVINKPLGKNISVQKRLRDPTLTHPQLVAVKQIISFTASFLSSSPNTSFQWTVSRVTSRGKASTLVQEDTASPHWQYAFPQPDTYSIEMTAENLINSVSTASTVIAYHPVSGLVLEASSGPDVKLGAHVTFTARVAGGTQVGFVWDFGGSHRDLSTTHITHKELSSTANHTFTEPGEYSISVSASNPYNNQSEVLAHSMIVLEPVSDLSVRVDGAVLTGNTTVFVAGVSSGTRVQYEFDYGEGYVPGTISDQGRGGGVAELASSVHTFTSRGVKEVTVRAFNGVSEVLIETVVVVQDEIPVVRVELMGPAVKGEYAVMTVRDDKGNLLKREDTVIEWRIDGAVVNSTQAPVTSNLFPQAKDYNVTITISNLVSQGSVSRNVSVKASSSATRFNQTVTTAVGQPISFYLVSLPNPPLDILVIYDDNNHDTEPGIKSGDSHTWVHTYTSEGLYEVSASPTPKADPSNNTPVKTVISVQLPITDLSIEGPAAVPIHSVARQYLWSARIGSGSHVIYNWTVGTDYQLITTHNQLVHEFSKAGSYQITVTARNGLSKLSETRNVIVQYPVSHLRVTTSPVVRGNVSKFELLVTGGLDIMVHVNFGDGNSSFIKMSDPGVHPEELVAPSDTTAGKYKCQFEHLYGGVGERTVVMNVTNLVSWKELAEVAVVAEPISGVKVESSTPSVIHTDEIVVVRATVESGTDLTYQWRFLDEITNRAPQVNSSGRESVARHSFVMEGVYTIQVLVSNDYYSTPVEAFLPYNFTVCMPIEDLRFFLNDDEDSKASLFRDQHGNASTEQIGFTAATRGSQDIKYLFDYGDGRSEVVTDTTYNMFTDQMIADGEHRYTRRGEPEFTPRVTAITACGNKTLRLSTPIYVQYAPEDLKLDRNVYNTRLGSPTTFQAAVSAGTDMHFDWEMGDGDLLKDGGSAITHTYRSTNKYTVTVTAYNHVGSRQAIVTVNVQEVIQGVVVEVSNVTVISNAPITFTAVTEPRSQGLVDYYEWNFGDRTRGDLLTTYDGVVNYQYNRAAKYVVTVKVFNALGESVSEPIQVHVVDPISDLRIELITQDVVVNKPIEFLAHNYAGSDVIYYWSMGDGHLINTPEYKIKHTYNRTAIVNVHVRAANPVSSRTATVRLFVVHAPCRPPDILILGPKNTPRLIKKSEALKIEADVKINCSITSETVYSWSIHNQTSQNITFDLTDGDRPVFRDPILFFGTKVLPYGDYFVELEVSMNNTIVYANKRANFSIVPSELLAVITGGLHRIASRQEDVIMDASGSADPDEQNAIDFGYQWECTEFANPDKSCFIDDDSAPILGNQSQISVPGHLFKANVKSFVFNLTVWRPNRKPSWTTQVVDMQAAKLLDLSVSCQQCVAGLVNADEKVVLTADYISNYLEAEMVFSWTMFIVLDGNDGLPAGAHDSGRCVAADGTTYSSYRAGPDLNNSEESSAAPASSTTQTDAAGAPTTQSSTSSTSSTTTTRWPPVGAWPQPDEASSGGRGPPAWDPVVPQAEPGPGFPFPVSGGEGSDFGFNPVEGDPGGGRPSSAQGPGLGIPLGEGVPGEAGSSGSRQDRGGVAAPGETPAEGNGGGRGYGSGQTGEPSGPPGSSEGDRGTQGGEGDPVMHPTGKGHQTPNLVSLQRTPRFLGEKHTSTGTNQRILIIKPGVLNQNRTYILEVNVTHPGSGRNGKAFIYILVNESPTMGSCTLTPPLSTEAIEMETMFRIYCFDWQDQEGPIRYEVSYNRHDDQPRDLVYQGLNHQVSFQLAAGDPANDYKLKVHIAIIDALGAKTELCSIALTVLQKKYDTSNQTEEEILYDLVEKDGSDLQTYVDKGDSRNARLHAQMVADRLNRLSENEEKVEKVKEEKVKETNLRQKIRSTVLRTLKDLPMRDQYEIQQTASAVSASTAIVDELNVESLELASTILDSASDEMKAIASSSAGIDAGIASVSIQGMSNVLSAVQRVSVSSARNTVKQIVESTTQALQKVLQAELYNQVTGEEPINRTTRSLYAYAGRYKSSTVPVIRSEAAKFQLPGNLEKILMEKSKSNSDCYEAHVINFKENPYLYGESDKSDIQTEVASLTLFTCEGRELEIQNLETNKRVEIEIPHKPLQDDVKRYVMYKHQMNIHAFNLSSENADQSLHIDVHLIPPTTEGRLFPIAILLRAHAPPDPEHHQLRWTFPGDQTNISVFIPPGSLNGSTTYYVGIVDEFYNAGRPREGEIRKRYYRLKLWWGQCLYWDDDGDKWSPTGCQIQSWSSYYRAHCACDHLTSFGAHFSLAPNDLNFTNVEDFFNLRENPVTFSLIATMISVYLIALIICISLDRYDDQKGKPVHLVDNSQHDTRKYIVTLETGFRKNAGTTAKVSIVLHGDKNMSETRELVHNISSIHGGGGYTTGSSSSQPLFERNSRDTFVITLPENLGRIFKVQIWHNNAGAQPSWYLSRCIVRDVIRGETSYFICEKWFAVEEEDGKIEREIMRTEHGLGFTGTLWAKGTQYFADYHLWFSLFSRPSYSRFTRAQRLTCCLSLVMSYMAVNAAWYRQTEKEYRGEFGLIDVSWRAVAVGAITSLLVLPVNLLLVLIFRRSKRKAAIDEELPEEKYKLERKESISSVDSSVVRMLQPVMTPPYQSMLNWQNLQDWAQRTWAKRNSEVASTADIKRMQAAMELVNGDQEELGGLEMVRSPEDQALAMEEGMVSPQDITVPVADCETPYPASSPELLPPKDVIVPAPPWERSSDSDNSMHTPPPTLRRAHRREGSGPEPPPRPPRPPRALRQQALVRQSSGSSQTSGESHVSSRKGPVVAADSPAHVSASRQPSTSSQADSICYEHQGAKPKTSRISGGSTESDPCSVPSMPSSIKSTPTSVRSDWSSKSYMYRSERTSDYSSTYRPRDGELRKRSQRCYLPWGCQFLAWVLATIIILGCGAVTVLYGFHFGRTKSILWLQSLFFAFLQCAFITHPILIIIISLYTALRYREDLSIFGLPGDIVNEERSLLNTTKSPMSEEEEEFDQAKGIAARQRSRYLRFVRPPQEKQLIEARSKTIKEKKAQALIQETGLFLLQFILLVLVAFGKNTHTAYTLNHSLEVALTQRGAMNFGDITTVPQWWHWVEHDFIDSIYQESFSKDNRELRKVETSSLVGRINIKQMRVVSHSCDLPEKYQPTSHCRSFYTEQHANTSSYGPSNRWHNSFNAANGYQGKHGQYGGRGFVALLNETSSGAKEQLRTLEKSNWVDKYTRAIAIEFTLFHAPSSYFVAVRMLLEIPPTGGATPSHYIAATGVYRYITAWDNFILACELLFVAATLLRVRFVVEAAIHQGKEFIRTLWNGVAMLQVGLSLIFCSCFVHRFLLVGDTVERLRATYHEVYVDVSHIHHWDEVLRCLVGFTLFLVTLQLLKALRHRKPFAVLTNVFKHASFDILVFGLMFIILLTAYTSLGLALWGSLTQQFSSLDMGVQSVLGMMTGYYPISELSSSHNSVSILGWRLFVVSFLIFAVGSLTAYIIAVLNYHYRKHKKDRTIMVFNNGETLQYYWEQIMRGLRLWPSDDTSDDEGMLPPEFMIGEIQYQMEEMLFKMNALAGTSNLPEKPPMYFTDTDTDATYPGGEDGASSGSSGIERFDRPDVERDRASKIDEINADAHLAQLIQLDSIGADLLTQEKDKQLRAQMQLEIFRQLQARRQEVLMRRGSDCYTSSGSDHTGRGSGGRRGSGSISREGSQKSGASSSGASSPRQLGFGSKLHHRLVFPKPPQLGILFPTREEREGEDTRGTNSFTTIADVTPQATASESSISPGDALILQDISDKGSSVSEHLPLDDMSRADAVASHEKLRIVKQLLSERDVALFGDKITTHRRPPYLPKPRPRIPSDSSSAQGYEDIVMNADFSSEDDVSSHASSKCRTLRKTHSRGKGKGGELRHCKGSLDLDIGFDNDAFMFDSDVEGTARVHVGQRQAWS